LTPSCVGSNPASPAIHIMGDYTFICSPFFIRQNSGRACHHPNNDRTYVDNNSRLYFGGDTLNHLTTKELAFIEDEIRAEEITAKTFNWCASQCDDEEIRLKLEQLAESHQLKVAEISQYFNRTDQLKH
jgi:hypothetical protein